MGHRCFPPAGLHDRHGVWHPSGITKCTATADKVLQVRGPRNEGRAWRLCDSHLVLVALWIDDVYSGEAKVWHEPSD